MAYRDFVLAEDPLWYWEFEEAQGASRYADTTGRYSNGAVAGSSLSRVAGIESGRFALGIRPGSSQRPCFVLPSYVFAQLTDISIVVWFRANFPVSAISGGNLLGIIWKNEPSINASTFALRINSGGEFAANISTGTTSANFVSLPANRPVVDGAWHQLAVVRQGTLLSIYVDGAIAGQKAISGDPIFNGVGDCWIGCTQFYSNAIGLSYDMDELWIASRALSGETIKKHYLAATGVLGMGTLSGTAKRDDGAAVDRLLVRRWDTSKHIATVKPDANGAWSLSVPAGVYDATAIGPSGYQPVTHGPLTVGL